MVEFVWKDKRMQEAAEGIRKIKEEISEESGIVMRQPYKCRFKSGVRFIDKKFFYNANCVVCEKGLLDRRDVLEHRKYCKKSGRVLR